MSFTQEIESLTGAQARQALHRLVITGHGTAVREVLTFVQSDYRTYREITADDVGKPTFRAFASVWPVRDFIGRIMPHDVGKRVYLVSGILSVENDEQRAARLARSDS